MMSHFYLNSSIGASMPEVGYNVGNYVPTYAVHRYITQVDDDTIDPQQHYPNLWELTDSEISRLAEQINSHTCCILFLQDQIRAQVSYYKGSRDGQMFQRATALLRTIRVPLIVVGLGCNAFAGESPADIAKSLSPGQREFFVQIGAQARCIGVRGATSVKVLSELGIAEQVAPMGCPSMFLRMNPETPIPAWKDSKTVQGLVFGKHGWVSQDINDQFTPGTYLPWTLREWQLHIASLRVAYYKGVRMHGALVALACGVPAVVLSSDARAREMCEFIGIPNPNSPKCAELQTYDTYNVLYDRRWKAYDEWLSGALGIDKRYRAHPR
jgi:hypothetical protein